MIKNLKCKQARTFTEKNKFNKIICYFVTWKTKHISIN